MEPVHLKLELAVHGARLDAALAERIGGGGGPSPARSALAVVVAGAPPALRRRGRHPTSGCRERCGWACRSSTPRLPSSSPPRGKAPASFATTEPIRPAPGSASASQPPPPTT